MLVAHLRAALAASTQRSPHTTRLVGELYGLLVSDVSLSGGILTLVTALLRELSTELPKFVAENFAGSLASYSEGRLGNLIDLVLSLNTPTSLVTLNERFFATIFANPRFPSSIRLRAFAALVRFRIPASDASVIELLDTPATGKKLVSLDGSPASDLFFSVLLHSTDRFSEAELLHVGVFSLLGNFAKLRFAKNEFDSVLSPPNTPISERPPSRIKLSKPSPLAPFLAHLCVRILTQCSSEIAGSLFGNRRKTWKFVLGGPPLTAWTREFLEQTVLESVSILDTICVADPALVSQVFPHVRKVYERVTLRADSPGIALPAILQFFLNHSYLVIFDIDPAIRFFFTVHIPRLTQMPHSGVIGGGTVHHPHQRTALLALAATTFLIDAIPTLCAVYPRSVAKYFPAILQLAAWFPRLAGLGLTEVLAQVQTCCDQKSLLHAILDIPLVTALLEMSTDINQYVLPEGEEGDPFADSRAFLRLARSVEFRSSYLHLTRVEQADEKNANSDLTHLELIRQVWGGLPLTPRVAAASKLVERYLGLFFSRCKSSSSKNSSSDILLSVLSRFGRIFLFRPEISEILIRFVAASSPLAHPTAVVAAIRERVTDSPPSPLIAELVFLMGSSSEPLFVDTLRWLLTSLLNHAVVPVQEDHALVRVRGGRLTRISMGNCLSGDESCCLRSNSPTSHTSLACITISALARVGAQNPAFRPQTNSLFETLLVSGVPEIVRERLSESLLLLRAVHQSPSLLGNS